MKIYSTSDAHSCVTALEKAIEKVDLEDENSMLVLLGDYCDRGPTLWAYIAPSWDFRSNTVGASLPRDDIDANVMRYGELAVLEYDSETGRYSGPGLERNLESR